MHEELDPTIDHLISSVANKLNYGIGIGEIIQEMKDQGVQDIELIVHAGKLLYNSRVGSDEISF